MDAGHPGPTASPAFAANTEPTLTSPAAMTGVGVILGTAAYMSPEQARGKTVDKRADIWAMGCVLYEMLSGHRPFKGEDIADVIGAVMRLEPDWDALPSSVSAGVRAMLRQCLVKDPRRRIGSMSIVRFLLDQPEGLPQPTVSVVQPRRGGSIRWPAVALAGSVMSLLLGALAVGWWVSASRAAKAPRVARLSIAPAPKAALTVTGTDVAITRDGSRVVYVGDRGRQLFVRTLDTLEPVSLFTGTPTAPFVSPDGQWVGLVDADVIVKKVPIGGGPAVTLATLDSRPRGLVWGADDRIIFATNNAGIGLQAMDAVAGGAVTELSRPNRGANEADHVWPELLPDGQSVLFTITAVNGGLAAAQIALLDLRTGTHTVVVRGGSHARYVAPAPSRAQGAPGHLLYAAGGALWAVPFDLEKHDARGTPIPVVQGVATTYLGAADAALSADGTLVYVPGGELGPLSRGHVLVWVDRNGNETALPMPPRGYVLPRISPDQKQIAVFSPDEAFDISIWDIARSRLSRFTFDPGVDNYPLWTRDSGAIFFNSERDGVRNIYRQAANGTGTPTRISQSPNRQSPTAVSPDGEWLIFTERSPDTGDDVKALRLNGSREVIPLVTAPGIQRNGSVSPDGKWLLYESDESGQPQIWVRPFPAVTSGRWPVTSDGGTRPQWTSAGRQVVYVAPSGALMSVGVEASGSWANSAPSEVVKPRYVTMQDPSLSYDIGTDGRFLMVKELAETTAPTESTNLVVMLNWAEELDKPTTAPSR